MASHFAGGIFWKFREGILEMLIQPYVYKGEEQIRFPGGTNDEFPQEEILGTLKREMLGETGLTPLSGEEVWRKVCPARNSEEEDHVKIFFLIGQWTGDLREKPLKDGEELLLPPYPLDIRKIDKVIFRTHRPAFEAAIQRIAEFNADNRELIEAVPYHLLS